jgi:hypothetical protein
MTWPEPAARRNPPQLTPIHLRITTGAHGAAKAGRVESL